MYKICLISVTCIAPASLYASDKTIQELVDAVNGTPDLKTRDAGKEAKLRNHAKGFCTSGYFEPNPKLNDELAIPFFNQSKIDVTARFSMGGTNPHASDKTAGRFMSLKIDGDKENLNFVTTNSPVFFAGNLEDFFTFQVKVKQGPEGKQCTVKYGDTLWSIAKVYKVSVEQIIAWNKMTDKDKLTVGKTLQFYQQPFQQQQTQL
ncbi:LysM peptidoglycan-binding domain-containing protein [Shewanella algicola]|uniref:LysM peptidoglycan-binding domain-containing protein n=1 Tax=Shewanella algicola TaxID=640633 RepID=UPI003CD0DF14